MNTVLKRSLLKIPFAPSVAAVLGLGGARLRALSDLPKRGVGAEIGVHIGDFSDAILSVAKPKKLHLIDPWKCFESEEYGSSWYGNRVDQNTMDERYSEVCERFKDGITKGRLEVHRNESRIALGELENNSLDFVYIDGDHTYEGVKGDLELSLEKVKVGGVITGDDYGPGSWWEGGVKRAVDEFGWNESVKLLWIEGTQFFFRKCK
ncbi:class I SAM-dependent methyltransferase [Haloferula rosea]|uniref:Class I SAM-dependent methyltransferase n=1 Tax=Haloferula rosea TaxID=490093 RepID=A0A934RB71_9BACT|nr:class I SAM-dependent methyltransferase [Haloferula rosea]MBK1827812.1 class I SAM-dependent methyltransferase [Haloferula rosea]